MDNLKSYKNKNKRKDRRAITKADDLNNTKFLANIRSKSKRFGTTVESTEDNDSESEEKTDPRERKSKFLSKLKEHLPVHMQREVPKRSTFAACQDEFVENFDDESSPDLKKNGHGNQNFSQEDENDSQDSAGRNDLKALRKSSSYDKINDDFFHGKRADDDDDLESSR